MCPKLSNCHFSSLFSSFFIIQTLIRWVQLVWVDGGGGGGGGGKFGSMGSISLEKPKLDLSQKIEQSSPELATGGGCGDIWKKNIFHGDGGDGDDDDNDFLDDFDEDIMTTREMMDLPAGFWQAYEMGLVSFARMVRFLAINARPTTARFISRSIPQGFSRTFIGRMIADPAFLYKLLLEQAATIECSVWSEVKNR